MRTVSRLAIVVVSFTFGGLAMADTLRCTGGLAGEGDSRASLVYKCGQPVVSDSFCAPVYVKDSPYPLPEHIALRVAPCIDVEEWIYERGPGNLAATVRLRSGRVESIKYARSPR
jgi:hypothetical protein